MSIDVMPPVTPQDIAKEFKKPRKEVVQKVHFSDEELGKDDPTTIDPNDFLAADTTGDKHKDKQDALQQKYDKRNAGAAANEASLLSDQIKELASGKGKIHFKTPESLQEFKAFLSQIVNLDLEIASDTKRKDKSGFWKNTIKVAGNEIVVPKSLDFDNGCRVIVDKQPYPADYKITDVFSLQQYLMNLEGSYLKLSENDNSGANRMSMVEIGLKSEITKNLLSAQDTKILSLFLAERMYSAELDQVDFSKIIGKQYWDTGLNLPGRGVVKISTKLNPNELREMFRYAKQIWSLVDNSTDKKIDGKLKKAINKLAELVESGESIDKNFGPYQL